MKNVEKEFISYVEPYLNLGFECNLKLNHTFRVVNYCKEIAESLNLSKRDIELAEICGLLHDIGRFEQWKRYKTFVDSKSIDHGDFGCEILLKNDYIEKYTSNLEEQDIVLKSVKNHNKYKIDNNLTDREQLFCNIVRDADKLDILYLETTGEIRFLNIEDSFSSRVYNNLMNNKQIAREDKKTRADILSISLGFIYDMNYLHSIEILQNKCFIDEIVNYYSLVSENEEFKKQIEDIRKHINNYMKERGNEDEIRKSYCYNKR